MKYGFIFKSRGGGYTVEIRDGFDLSCSSVIERRVVQSKREARAVCAAAGAKVWNA